MNSKLASELNFKESSANWICLSCGRKYTKKDDNEKKDELMAEHRKEHTMIQKKVWMGTTKGELMDIAYNGDKEKLRNVDCALPLDWTKENPNQNTFWFVMDYNGEGSVFGRVRDLREVAKENNVHLIFG